MIKGSIYKFSICINSPREFFLLAMASKAFFPSGFVPRHPREAKPPLLASQVISLAVASKSLAMARWWRANMPLCLFFPLLARHGELDCLGGE